MKINFHKNINYTHTKYTKLKNNIFILKIKFSWCLIEHLYNVKMYKRMCTYVTIKYIL